MYELFASRCYELLLGKFDSDNSNTSLSTLSDMNKKTDTLMNYQRDELRYHKNNEDKWKQLKDMSNRAYIDRLLATHLSNIIYLPKNVNICFTTEEKMAIIKISNSINNIPLDGVFKRESKSVSTLKSSVKILEEFDKNQIKSHVIYEILLIYNLLDNRFVKT